MTISAKVDFNGQTEHFASTPESEEAVRFKFNPSALPAVNRVKLLTSLLVAEIDRLREQGGRTTGPPNDLSGTETFEAARRFAVSASMWTVLGATKGI